MDDWCWNRPDNYGGCVTDVMLRHCRSTEAVDSLYSMSTKTIALLGLFCRNSSLKRGGNYSHGSERKSAKRNVTSTSRTNVLGARLKRAWHTREGVLCASRKEHSSEANLTQNNALMRTGWSVRAGNALKSNRNFAFNAIHNALYTWEPRKNTSLTGIFTYRLKA